MLLKEQIYDLLASGQSVILVGPSNAGKSRFAKEDLAPYLSDRGLQPLYFSDCNDLDLSKMMDDCRAIIIDEVELLQDKKYLESVHGEDLSYYTDKYLAVVKDWFEKLKSVTAPCIYIVTRNEDDVLANFLSTIKTADWDGREVVCLLFKK